MKKLNKMQDLELETRGILGLAVLMKRFLKLNDTNNAARIAKEIKILMAGKNAIFQAEYKDWRKNMYTLSNFYKRPGAREIVKNL